jgi:hypothetical protein
MVNDVLNPLHLDHSAVRTLAHNVEVLGEFHKRRFTKRYNFVKSRRPNATVQAAHIAVRCNRSGSPLDEKRQR